MLPEHRWGCCCCSTCCPDTHWSWQSCPQRGQMLSPRSHGGCPRLTWRRSAADRGQSRKTGLSPRNGRSPGETGRQRSLSPVNKTVSDLFALHHSPHLAALPLEGVCLVPALPGLYPAQAPHVALPGVHLQPAVSPGGPVPLKLQFRLYFHLQALSTHCVVCFAVSNLRKHNNSLQFQKKHIII